MRATLVALLVLALTACSKDKEIDPPAELSEFHATLPVERAWSEGVGGKGEVLRLGLGVAVADGKVYAAGFGGEVEALDLKTGRKLWVKHTKVPFGGGPGLGEELIAVGTSDGQVLAFNRADGAQRWRVKVSSEVLSVPAIATRVVVVRTVDGKLHGLAPSDGHELWAYEQPVPRLSLRGTSNPTIVGDVVICGFDNGKVAAVNLNDGTQVWESTVAPPHGRTEIERLVDIDSRVDIVGQDVYVVGFQGRVAMLALDSGQVWWAHDASSYRGLALDDDALYFSTSDGDVVALQRRSGTELWRQSVLKHRRLSAPTLIGNTIAVADFQGYVHWLDKATGALAARMKTGKERIDNPPLAQGNMLLVINDARQITAFRVGGKSKGG